ncbi:MAG: hypothetical protein Q7T16_03575 [Candidatus Burarchaeum sp.]|nr:hypothetical protein [Candidatus Burarchaeum sp.]MDO8339711.1 hypothetical protein [Candidatus Burarchaeum sp.]
MKLLFAAVLMLLVSVAFAQNAVPITGTLDLTFVDANGHPVPGALVDYTYTVSGTGYTSDTQVTGTATTDANGHFSAVITADARPIQAPLVINLTYQGVQVFSYNKDTWLALFDRPKVLTVPIGALEVSVKDQKGAPIEGVELFFTFGESTASALTDSTGVFNFAGAVSGTEYMVTAKYGTTAENKVATPPARVEFTMPAYNIIVKAVDDNGLPIQAGLTVNVSSLGKKFTGNGEISLTQVPPGEIEVTAKYGRASQQISVLVKGDGTQNVVFDLNAPTISNERTEPAEPGAQEVQVVATVADGQGVGIANVVLAYSVDKEGEQLVAMIPTGAAYSASIPRQAAGSLVEYYVAATDKNGNRIEGLRKSYVVSTGTGGNGGSNQTTNGTGGSSGGQNIMSGNNLLLAGGAVVLVVFVAAMILFMRKKKQETA